MASTLPDATTAVSTTTAATGSHSAVASRTRRRATASASTTTATTATARTSIGWRWRVHGASTQVSEEVRRVHDLCLLGVFERHLDDLDAKLRARRVARWCARASRHLGRR